VGSVAFSPDGEILVSGGWDGTIRAWDVATSRQISMLRGHSGGIGSLAFSPDGQSLVSASGKTVKLWDAPPRRSRDTFTEHVGWVQAVALSPDGKTLVTSDFHRQALKLWEVPSGSFSGELLGHIGIPTDIAFSPDGKFVASGSTDRTVRLWDLSKPETPKQHPCQFGIESVTFSSDGKTLGAAGDGFKLWNVASGGEIELIRGDTHSITQAAVSLRGGLLATSHTDGRVSVWDANDGREITSFDVGGQPNRLTISVDGNLVAVGNNVT
jgi:WD40 repeat protein